MSKYLASVCVLAISSSFSIIADSNKSVESELADKLFEDMLVEEVTVDGLGVVEVGKTLRHRKFGIGLVNSLIKTETVVTGMILFENESRERPMIITPEHFSQPTSN